jgi:hypothetical protein
VTAVQRQFRRESGLNPHTRPSIYAWYKQFTQSGCLYEGKSSGRPPVHTVRHSPRKSTGRASRKVAVPQPTVWKTVKKSLQLNCYKFQSLQRPKPNDNVKRITFCAEMMEKISVQDDLMSNVVFSDEATLFIRNCQSSQCADMRPGKPSRNDRARQGQSKGECVLCLICK